MAAQQVVFTAFNRADYMRQVLSSWSQVRGVDGAVLDFHLEPDSGPGGAHMLELCQSVDFGNPVVHRNDSIQGVLRNPHSAIMCGFRTFEDPDPSDFVILAEDDMIVSQDILEYFDWCSRVFYRDWSALAVSACQHRRRPGGPSAVYPGGNADRPYLWVWGTWRDRWEGMLAPDWQFDYNLDGWDWRIHNYWVKELGFRIVTPAESRCQHIGQHGGTHMNPAEHAEVQSDCFTREIYLPNYRLVT